MQTELNEIAQQAQEHLDTDPRYFNKDDGSFMYDGSEIYFKKTEDSIYMFVDGVVVIVERI